MNFTYLEKKAMVRMLMSLAMQDGKIDNNEIEVIKDCLDVDDDLLRSSSQVDIMEAVETVKSMHISMKLKFSDIAVKVANADGFVHPNERELIAQYFSLTGVSEFVNAVQEYNDAIGRLKS